MRVILDCDPGVDDALAIMFLIAEKVKLEAITTVAGNHEVDKTSYNALRILDVLGEDRVPVYRGSKGPLTRSLVTAEHIHGSDGLGDSNLPPPKRKVEKEDASEFLARFVDENTDKVHLIATGPLTNIAKAFRYRPWIVKKIESFTIMGGCFFLTPFGYGNVTKLSEFNFFTDPEATYYVFKSGAKPNVVGLDITQDPGVAITDQIFGILEGVAKRIVEKPFRKLGIFHLHDPIAVASFIYPDIFKFKLFNVSISLYDGDERGMCIVDRRGIYSPNANIAYKVNRREFLLKFLKAISKV